jgi:uncharacterized membrane protein (DUF106 family)
MSGVQSWKKSIERMVLFLGFFMMIAMMSNDFRSGMAEILDPILNPLAEVLPFHIVILILAAITGIYASFIQKYTIDWKVMKKTQEKMKEFQKEFKEARVSENKYKLKKLEERRAEMMEDQSKMMMQQFKPMGYTLIVTIPIWVWLWSYVNLHTGQSAIDPILSTMVFPLIGERPYDHIILGHLFPYWIIWYMLCSLPIGQFARKLMNIGA